jgi:hypothetical protein
MRDRQWAEQRLAVLQSERNQLLEAFHQNGGAIKLLMELLSDPMEIPTADEVVRSLHAVPMASGE